MKKILLTIIILGSLASAVPAYVNAQDTSGYTGLVQCDGVVTDGEGRDTTCNFAALINTANYIIRWLFMLTIPIFIGIGAYSGFLFMMPPSSGRREKAKKMLQAALTGFVIMLSSWLIVTTLLKWLVDWNNYKGVDDFIEQTK